MEVFSPCGLIGLAPMAGPGDSGFRRICKEYGADYTVSEMISTTALKYGAVKTYALAQHTVQEEPFLIQLFGHDPELMKSGVAYIYDRFHPVAIDINMGCPAPKIFNNGDGSSLLKEPKLASALVRVACSGAPCPISVKMRVGVDAFDDSLVDFAKRLEDSGASFITVHGRTREQFYSGNANYEMIAKIKQGVSIPVIANGDVVDGASAARILRETGADGFMLARGALGCPDVFFRIKRYLCEGEYSIPTVEERMSLCMKQLLYSVEDKGEEKACVEFRKHMLWYLKGIPGVSELKVEAGHISSISDCETLIFKVIQKNKPL